MPYKRIKQGKPFTFHEFLFFSPRQFDQPLQLADKEFIYRLKICTNSGRCFTGPFVDEVIGEEEITEKELKQVLKLVEETPGIIITGREYTRYDDYGGLQKLYG